MVSDTPKKLLVSNATAYRNARLLARKSAPKRPKRVPATQRPTNPLTGLLSSPVLPDRWLPDVLEKIAEQARWERNKRKAQRRKLRAK